MNKQRHIPTYALKKFEWAVRAIAASADQQLSLFPTFVCVADELALDFEESYKGIFSDAASQDFTPAQLQAIQALDLALEQMSGGENLKFWTDEALKTFPEWTRLRKLAQQVIAQFNWSSEPPPSGRAIYLGPPE